MSYHEKPFSTHHCITLTIGQKCRALMHSWLLVNILFLILCTVTLLGSIHKFNMWHINEKVYHTMILIQSCHIKPLPIISDVLPLDKGIYLNHLSQQSLSLLHRDPLIIPLCWECPLFTLCLITSFINKMQHEVVMHEKLFHITGLLWGEPLATGDSPHKVPVMQNLWLTLLLVWTICWTSNQVARDLKQRKLMWHDVGTRHNFDGGIVQERHNSNALAIELPFSCTSPSICSKNIHELTWFVVCKWKMSH